MKSTASHIDDPFKSQIISEIKSSKEMSFKNIDPFIDHFLTDLELLEKQRSKEFDHHQLKVFLDDAIREVNQHYIETLHNSITLNEVFEYYVDTAPEQVAILTDHSRWTYAELEAKANRVARHLVSLELSPGDLVGVYFNRGEMPIISVLGILKAGVAYVPLDPAYPEERIKYILESANIKALLTEDDLKDNISDDYTCSISSFDDQFSILKDVSPARMSRSEVGHAPDSLSYILFTSGTTGKPKGIMTEHRNVVNFMKAHNKICKITPKDRIYQGFSIGFDGSVEELWMAFGSGATLVIGNQRISNLGDETAAYMTKMGVTVFSTVPTFLGLIKQDLPNHRLLIVSGEPCPPELVERWSTDKRVILNVYGPTETTVNTTFKALLPGEPVTIGKALDGYDTFVLDKNLKPVAPGDSGELYIGGTGLARGYFNAPELTAKAFIPNPFDIDGSRPRIYKTGDEVFEKAGEIHFVRRMDTQVKIKGFRIELAEIESVLRSFPEIDQAVVNVYKHNGQNKLAAYIVGNIDSANFNASEVLNFLRDIIPHYMVPSFLDVLDSFPMLASGKADRKNFPEPVNPLVDKDREIIEATTQTEKKLHIALVKVLENERVSIRDNFFVDLGGDSLGAVEFVTELRTSFGYDLSVRDIYSNLTIEKMAKVVEEMEVASNNTSSEEPAQQRRSAKEIFHSVSRLTRFTCYSLQALSLTALTLLLSTPIILLVWLIISVIAGTVTQENAITIFLAILLFTQPIALLFSIAFKWTVIGRYKSGRYPLYSMYYFRVWITNKVVRMSTISGLAGTPVMNSYLRMMGAKIGAKSIIDTGAIYITDLITVGENSCIGAETSLMGYKIENQELVIGSIEIGDNCYIGSHSDIAINTKMEDGSRLGDLSALDEGKTLQMNTSYKGSPAQEREVDLSEFDQPVSESDKSPFSMAFYHLVTFDLVGLVLFAFAFKQSKWKSFWIGLYHLFAFEFIVFLFFAMAIPTLGTIFTTFYYYGASAAIGVAFFWSVFGVPLFCVLSGLIKKLILNQTVPGVYDNHDSYYFKKWIMDLFLGASSQAVYPLFTTIYLPTWLRFLGAKIGKMAEISTISNLTPDLCEIGDGSFFADGAIVGGRRFHNGKVLFAGNKIGSRSFVGNNAMLPLGEDMGDDCLLGVLSSTPSECNGKIPNGTEWLGSPAFQLPFRNKVTHFDDETIFKPTKKLLRQRLFIDALRIIIPNFIGLTAFIGFVSYLYYGLTQLGITATVLGAPFIVMGLGFSLVLIVALLKKIVMGTMKPEVKPLWCVYIWLNEMVNGAYESIAAPLMSPYVGTPFHNWFLRLMGCKVGKHCYVASNLYSEFDLIEIGDYCCINEEVILQNHLFEDRVFKSSYIKLGNECTIGNKSIVLYDTELGDGVQVAPQSLVMKGDDLKAETSWLGIPVERKS